MTRDRLFRASAFTLLALMAALPAGAAVALPAVGAQIGASAEEVRTALDVAGCPLQALEAEAGKVAARCKDGAGEGWKVVIDPTTGRVTEVLPAE